MSFADLFYQPVIVHPDGAPWVRTVRRMDELAARQRSATYAALQSHDAAIDAAPMRTSTVGTDAMSRARALLLRGPITTVMLRDELGVSMTHAKRLAAELLDLGEVYRERLSFNRVRLYVYHLARGRS